jgi:hypothetical protein
MNYMNDGQLRLRARPETWTARPSSGVNKRVRWTDEAIVDVLPRDITTLPHVLGSDLIEYLITASAESSGKRGGWDPFTEAAGVIDPSQWYTRSFDASPDQSVTRWLPPDGSGLATVGVHSQAGAASVLIRYVHGGS